MRPPPDRLLALTRLLHHPDYGCHNIGVFVREHADQLSTDLHVPLGVLHGMADQPDHLLVRKLEGAVRAAVEERMQQQATATRARAEEAAHRLGTGARWRGSAAHLDASILLGDLLVDRSMKVIAFQVAGQVVAVERRHLVGTAKAVGHRSDLVAFIDSAGLHFRWHGRRGGLNWWPQPLPSDQARVLHVSLRQAEAAPIISRTRRRSWSWESLSSPFPL